jgi:dTDP-4-amino-4,6-dideoxy-D-galactose acyltransferase
MDKIASRPTSKFYAGFNFLSNSDDSTKEWHEEFLAAVDKGDLSLYKSMSGVEIYYRYLKWDSDFFTVPTYRIDYSYIPDFIRKSKESFEELFLHLQSLHPEFYLFAEIPSEDIQALSSMTAAGYSLIESRLTYFNDQIQQFDLTRRYATRQASGDDIAVLTKTAIEAVNVFDRFHADDFFTTKESDAFLAKYTENSVLGFADEVMVPADGLANAFLTAIYVSSPRCLSNKKIAKMVLSAVATERRGWYVKLIGEMTQKFKEQGVDTAFMTTQSTNRAVLKVWTSFGYRFGKSTHILSKYCRNI